MSNHKHKNESAPPRDADKTIESHPSIDALPDWNGEATACRSFTATVDRRLFLKSAALLGLAAACPSALQKPATAGAAESSDDEARFIKEARYYGKLPHKKIRCDLCPRECVIDDMERGYCGVRENRGGTYYTMVHSRPCTYHADPVEKKPLFHFHPGTLAFSIATAGCNVNCKFCQNWEISQVRPEQIRSIYMPPKDVAALAKQHKCRSIAYTYSEPIIFYEYMLDAAKAGHDAGLFSAAITGGYIKQEPLQEMCAHMDAIKVDVKSYSEEYYRDVVNGELRPVLDGLVTMRNKGVWLEIVYLVVPALNDSDAELTGLARWVRSNLGNDVPIHFTRFHPQYLMKNL
ncbi:MAG: AmmeMemoRadiSam system radical SAM enzyme, partial [Candidatus Latescibacterota bacterium]